MLRLTELKLPLDHAESEIRAAVLKRLQIKRHDLVSYSIFRRAIDARKKSAIALIYALDVDVKNEAAVLKRLARDRNVSLAPDVSYKFVARAPENLTMRPVVIGLAAGLAGAGLVSNVFRATLFGVAPLDPLSFLGVTIVLLLAAGLACFVPARRAGAIDPVLALRHE